MTASPSQPPTPPADLPLASALRGMDLDADRARRARLAAGFGKLGCVAGTLFTGFYLAIGHGWGALVVALCTGLFAFTLAVCRQRRLNLAGNLYALVLTGGFSALTAIEGGLHGHAIAWLACVPLCACMFVNPSSGWVWCGVCLGVVGVFSGLSIAGVAVPSLYPPEWGATISAAGYLALAAFMATLGMIFESSRRNAFAQLQTTLLAFRHNNEALDRSLRDLRESEGRFRSLFENSALGVALLDWQGEVQLGSGRLVELLRLVPGERVLLTSLVIEPERDAFLQLLSQQPADDDAARPPGAPPGPRQDADFTLRLPAVGGGTGEEDRLFHFSLSWVRETRQVCALVDDVTEQREMERNAVMHEKSTLLDSLVGGIAHELNNKLTPIVGFSEMLVAGTARGRDASELNSAARVIHGDAVDAGKIIAQLTQLARPVATDLRRCDLRRIVEEACAVLSFRVRDIGARLELRLPGREVIVQGDPAQIKQVVLNLILNALDALEHAPERRLELSVSHGGELGSIEIADTGQGMTPEVQARVFEPFFTTKSGGRGTGLGLSVCANLIQRHGGEITVESWPGGGSRFTVWLPLAGGSAPVPTTTPAASGRPATLPPPAAVAAASPEGLEPLLFPDPALSGARRAMVIDDEEAIAELVAESLHLDLGFEVEQFGTGEAALARLRQGGDYDLIVSDIRLPGLSGFDVIAWVREHRAELAPRVLVITGDAGSAERNARLTDLGVPVLLKPFLIKTLLEKSRAVAGARLPSR